MMFKSRKSRLDQYLPAMLLAREIRAGYSGEMSPEELDERLAALLADRPASAANAETGPEKEAPVLHNHHRGPILDDAFFAACAYIDEALMTSGWRLRDQWPRRGLARRYFATAQAGTEFFERLARLLDCGRPDPAADIPRDPHHYDPWRETLEVFAAALTLGFTGRYYDSEDLERLEAAKGQTAEALGSLGDDEAGKLPDLTCLAPKKPGGQAKRRLLSFFLYALPLSATAALLLAHRAMLIRFTLDWAKAFGALP
ncbi:MAG: DotU family type IV/VI secretion system protein [Candidatus Adiutrix sp.]|jgi:type VI secretion system protein ImpK|nr:DotU family type IV/VI secretion system protein [Candidatus Adiutrix sp.]